MKREGLQVYTVAKANPELRSDVAALPRGDLEGFVLVFCCLCWMCFVLN